MKRLLFALCTLGALLLTACGPNRSKELDNIRTLESTVREADMVASPETALQLTNSYLQFSQNFPDDSLTPIFLYNASDLSLNIGRYDTRSIACGKSSTTIPISARHPPAISSLATSSRQANSTIVPWWLTTSFSNITPTIRLHSRQHLPSRT